MPAWLVWRWWWRVASVWRDWRHRAAQERFDGFQQARQCVGFGRGQVGEECSEFGSHQVLRGLERYQAWDRPNYKGLEPLIPPYPGNKAVSPGVTNKRPEALS